MPDDIIWEKQERGWYTSAIGAVCIEDDGKWYFWTVDNLGPMTGPFKSLRAAKEEVERHVKS